MSSSRDSPIGTSALEGTFAEITELFAAEVLPFDGQETELAPNVREVMNHARAADAAYGWIGERPITLGMSASLQAEIVRGTGSDGPEAGSIRESQVFIGAKHRRVSEARFVPPPPGDQLRSMCERWITWLSATGPVGRIQLLALREEVGDVVRTSLPRARPAGEIADDLVAYPILSVSDAQRRYGRTHQANRNAISSLLDLGILEPYSDVRYDRLYWNRRVFQIIDS